MIVPPGLEGVLWPRRLVALYGPDLLPLVEREYRQDGRQVPPDLRKVLEEMAEMGREYLLAEVAKRTSDVRTCSHPVDTECSSPTPWVPVVYTQQVAEKLGIGARAVQRRAARGTLPATLVDGAWQFDAAAVDRLAQEVK